MGRNAPCFRSLLTKQSSATSRDLQSGPGPGPGPGPGGTGSGTGTKILIFTGTGTGSGTKILILPGPGPGPKFSGWSRSFFYYQKLDSTFIYLLFFL